jgi:hypothetical protein
MAVCGILPALDWKDSMARTRLGAGFGKTVNTGMRFE